MTGAASGVSAPAVLVIDVRPDGSAPPTATAAMRPDELRDRFMRQVSIEGRP